MKKNKYKLPEDNQPNMVAEPAPSYHGNVAMALPEEDVNLEEDIDWDRKPYLESPTNAEEAVAQIRAIEEDDEKAGINYTIDEFFQELQKVRTWQ